METPRPASRRTRCARVATASPDTAPPIRSSYSVPKLGGQDAGYIVKALQDYRSGARKHPSMNGIAASLSDQDMADLAAYYAGGK